MLFKLLAKLSFFIHKLIRRVKMHVYKFAFKNAGKNFVFDPNDSFSYSTISVGDYVFIGPSSYICGKVKIKDEVYIGTGAKILPRLLVGSKSIIGSCSLVNKNISSNERIIGIPGRSK